MTEKLLEYSTNQIKKIVSEDELKPGDVVGVHRMSGLYDHYGIYTGNGGMIHYADQSGDFGTNIVVHRTTLQAFKEDSEYLFIIDFDKFIKKNQIKIFDIITPFGINVSKLLIALLGNTSYHIYSPEETVQRAESRLGEKNYNIATNNCEHFAIWCKTGVSESTQIENFLQKIRGIRIH